MSSTSSAARAVPARVKACDGCRQLKLRCDAHESNYGGACSRCRRTRRNCTIDSSPGRRNRQTKADMERELEKLRAQYRRDISSVTMGEAPGAAIKSFGHHVNTSPSHEASDDYTMPPTTAPESASPVDRSFNRCPVPPSMNGSHGSILSQSSPSGTYTSASACSNGHMQQTHSHTPYAFTSAPENIFHNDQQFPKGASVAEIQVPNTATLPRTIGNKQLDPRKIDGCISLFFENYAPTLPGVYDSLQDANDLYNYSVFLFWTVVYVGSRKYSKDPTIFETVTGPLELLTHQSMFDPENTIPTLQAAFILCLWPFPSDSTYKTQSHAISGAAMQLAIQKGLPFASREQDFIRIPLAQPQHKNVFRARLWAYCLMIFQANSLYDGLPFPMPFDPIDLEQIELPIFSGLPEIVSCRYRLHRVLTDACASILRSTNLTTDKDSDLLDSLICHYDTEAQRVYSYSKSDDEGLISLCSVRIMIRAFHFFGTPNVQRSTGILQAFFIACEFMECAGRLDRTRDFGSNCDYTLARAMVLCAVCILRVLRSPLSTHVDTERGEEMISETIRLAKKRSVRTNDLDSRTTTLLTQLWSCPRLFQFRGGTVDGLRLLLRGRLSMSVFFDALWWWRAEFGGSRTNPYLESAESQTALEQQDPITAAPTSGVASDGSHGDTNFSNQAPLDTNDPSDILENWSYGADLPEWNWQELGDLGLDWC